MSQLDVITEEMKHRLTPLELSELLELAKKVPAEIKVAVAHMGQIKLTMMERGNPIRRPTNTSRFYELSWKAMGVVFPQAA